MTYLEVVNNILKRLRERTVSTVEESSYSSLIGVLVNDALKDVENSHNWSGLRTTLTATTSANVFSYELNGAQNNLTVLDVINENDNFFLKEKDSHSFNSYFLNNNPQTGSPYYYSFNGISADGDTQVDLFPIPDKEYTIYFNVVLRSADMTSDANALAVEERGEDGGASPTSVFARAQNALQDAIALDALKHSDETIFYEA